jgi:hypothetical protein
MIMRDIPREEWHTFLDDFTRQHRDEPVSLEKSDRQDGLRVAARAALLKSASHNRAGEQISITVGEIPSGEVTLTVTRPDGVAVEEPRAGDANARVAVHVTGQHLVLRVGAEGRASPDQAHLPPPLT